MVLLCGNVDGLACVVQSVMIGTSCQEQCHNQSVAISAGHMERRHIIVRWCLDVGTSCQQDLPCRPVSVLTCYKEWGCPIVGLCVDVGTSNKQYLDHPNASLRSGTMKGAPSIFVGGLDVGSNTHQLPHHLELASKACC